MDHSTLNRWVLAYAPLIEKRLRAFRKPPCGSIRVDETSYEERCVKPVLLSAGRHRSFPCVLASVGAEVELRAARVPSPTSYPAGRCPRHDPIFGSEGRWCIIPKYSERYQWLSQNACFVNP